MLYYLTRKIKDIFVKELQLFTVQDPQGNIITLTERCWNDHISVNHTEMKRLLTQIKKTIINPDYIYQSKSSSKTHLYFKEYHNPILNCNYLLVAVFIEDPIYEKDMSRVHIL